MQESESSSGNDSGAEPADRTARPVRTDEAVSGGAASADELRAELTKWRERVPRLVGALKARTDELEALKSDLASLEARVRDNGTGDSHPAIRARDELIEELEAKVNALSERYQDAAGQLHARDLQISTLREEAQEWRNKWQTVTTSLDQQSDTAGEKGRELSRLNGELEALREQQNKQDARFREQDLELTALRQRSQSLESRNQNLFETTELANRQIETLGGNLEHLRGELKSRKDELARKAEEAEAAERRIASLEARLSERDQAVAEAVSRAAQEREAEVAGLTARLAEFEALNQSLRSTVATVTPDSDRKVDPDTAPGLVEQIETLEEVLKIQRQEVARLEECVARAEETGCQWESERRTLSQEVVELKRRNERFQSQLTERSDLVMGLEQEKQTATRRTERLEEENLRLTEALEKSERSAAENAEHIAHLDDRLDRQKQLMDDLEKEYAQIQEDFAETQKSHQREMADQQATASARHDDEALESAQVDRYRIARLEKMVEDARIEQRKAEQRAAEFAQRAEKLARAVDEQEMADQAEDHGQTAALQAEVLKLEGLVRERTEELNQLRWEQDMAARPTTDGSDSKMLVVLNQQLASARDDNQRLLVRIRELEDRQAELDDDLTRIRGIGPKLVEQLAELGITHLEQIATLDEAALDDVSHPLHAMKGRILKDHWISQAVSLHKRR